MAKCDVPETHTIHQLLPHGATMKELNLPNSLRETNFEMNARKQDTRRKILIGSWYLKKARQENKINELRTEMLTFLTRETDRHLFDDL